MGILLYLFLIVVGLAFGSFVNCLVYRTNHNFSFWKGRSFCPQCKKLIAWFDNLPLLSFISLRGHCRHCRQKISLQYPLVELAGALLALLAGWQTGLQEPMALLFSLAIVFSFLAIFVSDILYYTIPDEAVIFGSLASLAYLFLTHSPLWLNHLAAGLLAAGFFFFLVRITREKGMGWGDVKLAGFLGLCLGPSKTIATVFLAFLTGALVGVILMVIGRKGMKDRLPFGPFLVVMGLLQFFWGQQTIAWYMEFIGF